MNPRWTMVNRIDNTQNAIHAQKSNTQSTRPCFACHCTSRSFFSTRRGISASSPRYERTIMTPRFGLAPPDGEPGGGGGWYAEGGGGTVGSLIGSLSFQGSS